MDRQTSTPFKATMLQSRSMYLVLLTAISFVVVFYNLGRNSFHNGDEAHHALIIKEILRTGDWLTMHVAGEMSFTKPPLMSWFGAIACKTFGFSEFSVRFPAALFGVATIILTFLVAEQLYTRTAAVIAALAMLTCTQFLYVHASKTGEFDSAATFFVLLCLYMAWLSAKHRRALYVACASAGLLAMTKGVVCVIPLGAMLLYLLLAGRLRDFSTGQWIMAVFIFCLTALPWHILQIIVNGQAFIDLYFLDQTIGRRVGSGIPIGFTNPLYYPRVILRGFFPWSVSMPFAAAYLVLFKLKTHKSATALLLAWGITVLLVCNSITGKFHATILQTWYILPLYPALAIMTGVFFADLFKPDAGRRFLGFSLAGIIVLLAVLRPDFDYNPFIKQSYNSLIEVRFSDYCLGLYRSSGILLSLILLAAWLFLGLAATHMSFRRTGGTASIIAPALFCYVLCIGSILTLLPLRFSDYLSDFEIMGHTIWSVAEPGSMLVFYGNNIPLYQDTIYLHDFSRPHIVSARFIDLDRDILKRELSSSGKRLFFMEKQLYYDLRADSLFTGLLPRPAKQWDAYVLLSTSSPDRETDQDSATVQNAIDNLDNMSPKLRIRAAHILGCTDNPGAAPPLIRLLSDPSNQVVAAAARALCNLRYAGAVVPLKAALSRYRSGDETYAAIMLSLAYLRDADAVPFLITLFEGYPIYFFTKPRHQPPREFFDHNQFWTARLLLDIDRRQGRKIIFNNIQRYFSSLQHQGIGFSIYNRFNFQLYRIGNTTALDLLEGLLDSNNAEQQRNAVSLLAKPPSIITRLTENQMARARLLLVKAARQAPQSEVSALARTILHKYHQGVAVDW